MLSLHQSEALGATGGYYRPYNGRSLLDLDGITSVQDLTQAAIATTYARRNLTVSLHTPAPPVWTAATGVVSRNEGDIGQEEVGSSACLVSKVQHAAPLSC